VKIVTAMRGLLVRNKGWVAFSSIHICEGQMQAPLSPRLPTRLYGLT